MDAAASSLKERMEHNRSSSNNEIFLLDSEDEIDENDDDVDITSKPNTIASYIPPYLKAYVFPCSNSKDGDSDFCYTPHMHPRLLAQLMMEGFLPMAHSNRILLPKLHQQRCLIYPLREQLHIAKSTRRKASHYHLTINAAPLADVVAACLQQHGRTSCWLYPSLVQVFAHLQQATIQNPSGYPTMAADGTPVAIRFLSIEVWNTASQSGEPQLVAGELGYTVGDGGVYTSLTGFSRQDSAGSVQLATLGALLASPLWRISAWDLGMHMPYKEQLGGRCVPRPEFIALLHQLRRHATQIHTTTATTTNTTTNTTNNSTTTLPPWPIQQWKEPISCRDVIDAFLATRPTPKRQQQQEVKL